LFPLLPLLLASLTGDAWRAVRFLRARLATGRSAALALAAPALAGVALLCLFGLVGNFLMSANIPGFTRYNRAKLASERGAYRWIRENTPPEALVLSDSDPLLYLYTGRRGCRPIVPPRLMYFGGPAEARRFLNSAPDFARARHLGYIVYNTPAGAPARHHEIGGEPVVVPADLRLVYHSPGTSVYAVE
jgi:hypothetical protein